MGLRDHRPSILRTTTLKPSNSDEGREIGRIVGRAISANAAKVAAAARCVVLPRLDAMVEDDRDGGPEPFLETMPGGIAIACGILVGLVLLLWIGSLF